MNGDPRISSPHGQIELDKASPRIKSGDIDMDISHTLKCLQKELQQLKQQNKDLKYQIVMLHSDPQNSLDKETLTMKAALEEEIASLKAEISGMAQDKEEARITIDQLRSENSYLQGTVSVAESSLVKLRDQWKLQHAEIVRLREELDAMQGSVHSSHQHPLSSPHQSRRHAQRASSHGQTSQPHSHSHGSNNSSHPIGSFRHHMAVAQQRRMHASLPDSLSRFHQNGSVHSSSSASVALQSQPVKYTSRPTQKLPGLTARQAQKQYYARFK